MNKTILLASFIFPERTEWFLNYLETKFNIPRSKVFIYKNLDDESKVIITFKISTPEGKRLNLKDLFPSAIPIHKKGSALYTINALNRLIDKANIGAVGNVDYKAFKINWSEHQDKLIITNNDDLMFFRINRIF